MRELARKRKERIEAEREEKERERLEEGRKKREVKKMVPKKREREEEDETRPPAVGAHGLARQDGVGVHTGMFKLFQTCFGRSCLRSIY